MLSRSMDVIKCLHMKQYTIGQQAIRSIYRHILNSDYVEIRDNHFTNGKIFMWRAFSSKGKTATTSSPVEISTNASKSNDEINNDSTNCVERNIAKTKAMESKTTMSIGPTGKSIHKNKMEIETAKGLISVTTTIEDSKINEIVFEKAKTITAPPLTTTVTPGKSDTTSLERSSKQKDMQNSDKPINRVIKQVNKASLAATKTTPLELDNSQNLIRTQASASPSASISVSKSSSAALSPKTAVVMEVDNKPKRITVDCNRSSLERNFITPARAMSDFLLKVTDLEQLPKIKRRSPYEQEPPITVYWRKDVEAKAIEVWGSKEALLRESFKRDIERKTHQQNIFTVKRRLRDYRREIGSRTTTCADDIGLKGKSGKVVLIAIAINGLNFIFKVGGWFYSGSHSMFAEAIHSLADTINQLILAYGIHKSTQSADSDHPYGYSNMKYVSSLISGVGIFCVGTGLSMYHGITGLLYPEPMENFFWALFILGGSLVSEGATLLVAVNEIKRAAKLKGISFKEYVVSGKDPCVNVVLTEDAAAVASVAVAAACMGLSIWTGSPVYDAIGSLLVGSLLGAVASFIIYTNVAALVGKSIPKEHLDCINSELESDVMIRAIHDVKGIDMGNNLVRYKAEMDFDGRELTRSYLDKQDLNELLQIVKSFQTIDELEQFLLNHGENIVDLMGGEIDRIEMKLRKKFPEIRHCDLEIL